MTDWYLIVQAIMAAVTAGMAIATAVMAIAARASVKEMREERLERLAPRILVYFEVDPYHAVINLVIANQGLGAAKNVTIDFDKSIYNSYGNEITACPLLRDGIPYMPPGQVYSIFVDVSTSYFQAGLPEQFVAAVKYESAEIHRNYNVNFILDLSHWKGYRIVRTKTPLETEVEKIATELKKIRSLIEEKQNYST